MLLNIHLHRVEFSLKYSSVCYYYTNCGLFFNGYSVLYLFIQYCVLLCTHHRLVVNIGFALHGYREGKGLNGL